MTIAPFVELGFHPTDLRPGDLPKTGAFLGSPAEAMEAALAIVRARMVDQMHAEIKGIAQPTQAQLLTIMDLAWQGIFPAFRKVSAPMMADAYIRAYRSADAGDVPLSVIYALADKHAEKVGLYFYGSSREAMAEGFNTLVNRRLPAKAAAGKLMDAWGLTPRQVQAFIASQQLDTPVKSASPFALKARARAYIDRAFTSRAKKLSAQEEHNIEEQAKQYAWMWLQDKGRLSKKAQKIWITAKDEKVCKVCGPLNGKKVGVNEQFRTPKGEFWTPGVHPNCRCYIRLIENRFSKSAFGIVRKDLAGTALAEFNELHPRTESGRFGTKARTKTIDVDEEFKRLVSQPSLIKPVRHLTYADAEPDPEIDEQFFQLISAQPKRRGFTSVWGSPLEVKTFREEAKAQIADVEPMINFAADVAVELRAKSRLETKPKQRMKTPTIPVGQPAFAVIQNELLGDGEIDRIRFNHGVTFHTDAIGAAQEAGELKKEIVDRKVDDMIDQLAKDRGRTVKMEDPKTGEMLYAKMRPKDIEAIADWYGRSATSHHHDDFDPEDLEDEGAQLDWGDREGTVVTWYNEKGEAWGTDQMSYRHLGHTYFAQRSSDYEVYVAGIDQIATDSEVNDISGSANSRHREFSVDGDYVLRPETVKRTKADHFYDATSFMMDPEGSVELPKDE